jgi:hypothetical protein
VCRYLNNRGEMAADIRAIKDEQKAVWVEAKRERLEQERAREAKARAKRREGKAQRRREWEAGHEERKAQRRAAKEAAARAEGAAAAHTTLGKRAAGGGQPAGDTKRPALAAPAGERGQAMEVDAETACVSLNGAPPAADTAGAAQAEGRAVEVAESKCTLSPAPRGSSCVPSAAAAAAAAAAFGGRRGAAAAAAATHEG